MFSEKITTAFVLSAGKGTRLRPLTDACPKPLLPVNGRPLITYIFDHLVQAGVRRIIVNTHHLAEKYEETFPEKKWKDAALFFRHEPVLLDSAGGLKNIEDLWGDEENIFTYNGDVISSLSLSALMERHLARKNEVTLALRSQGEPRNVGLDEQDEVGDIRGVLGRQGLRSFLFTGIYAVNRRFLGRLEKGRAESVVDVFLRMIREKSGSVGGIVLDDGEWRTAGTLAEYEKINTLKQ
ncbi:MAG: nucleotidyltransferase family protein [bacterium]